MESDEDRVRPAMAYCTGGAGDGPPPLLALGPQNVGMNQKGIGLRRSLHDKEGGGGRARTDRQGGELGRAAAKIWPR